MRSPSRPPDARPERRAASALRACSLLPLGVSVRAFDPVASGEARRLYQGKAGAERLTFCNDAYEAAEGADALLICTEWQEFRSPDFERLRTLLREPRVFDGRNLYDPALMQQLGFEYYAIGRGRKLIAEGEAQPLEAVAALSREQR